MRLLIPYLVNIIIITSTYLYVVLVYVYLYVYMYPLRSCIPPPRYVQHAASLLSFT